MSGGGGEPPGSRRGVAAGPTPSSAGRILAALGDAVLALGEEGEVRYWSREAERLLGHPAAAVLGRPPPPSIGLPPPPPPERRRGERRLDLRRADGSLVRVVAASAPLAGADGRPDGMVLMLKDLAPWLGPVSTGPSALSGHEVEERLGASFRATMEATGADLDPGGGSEVLARRLAEQGRLLVPGTDCLIVEVPADRPDVFHCLAGAGPIAGALPGQTLERRRSLLERALGKARPVESIARPGESLEPGLFGEAAVRAIRVAPLATSAAVPGGGPALGALAVLRPAAAAFSVPERRLIDDFAGLVSLSLQRASFRAATERTLARLQLAVDVALDLAQSLDPVEVSERLVRRAAAAARAERCVLVRVEGGESGATVVEGTYDAAGYEALLGFRQPVGALPLLRQAVRSRLAVAGGPHRVSGVPPPLAEALSGVRHTLTVPLLVGGEVVGVLLLSRRSDPPFREEERATLQLLGSTAGLALRNSQLYARTQEASRVKTDFLDMAAHELRAPLTVVNGYVSMLRDGTFGPAPERWGEPLAVLGSKVAELRGLVEDLLLAARLETGRLSSFLEAVDLREAAERALLAAGLPPGPEAGGAPVLVMADREHLGRLLEQLLANALVYTREGEPGSVRLAVRAEPEARLAVLTVEDRGRGIPPEERERVFERFYRVEDPDRPVIPGTGLGLYIGRELAQRFNGHLELAWSEPGVGSRFALTLPLLAAQRPEG